MVLASNASNASTYYGKETLQYVERITQSPSEADRHEAIEGIVLSNEKDKARLLIDLFHYSAWRETQGALLKAIGATRELRGVEFLIRFIRSSQDLPMMAKATLGLGVSQSNLAGSFLLSMLESASRRLRLEALKGLTLMPQFHCDEQLIKLMTHPNSSESLKLHATIAAGRRGTRAALPVIMDFAQNGDATLKEAAILALGHLADSATVLEDIAIVHEGHTAQNPSEAPYPPEAHLLFDELTTYARDRIRQRRSMQVDDAILQATSEDQQDFVTRFRLLREIPLTHLRSAFDMLADTLTDQGQTHVLCMLRAVLHDPLSAPADIDFLHSNQKALKIEEAALLARACITSHGASFLAEFDPSFTCDLLTQVQVPDVLEFAEHYYQPNTQPDLAIAFINAVVAQSLMAWQVRISHIDFFLVQLDSAPSQAIKNRLLRALAQLGCTEADYLDLLATQLGHKETQASTAYCLSLLPSRVAAPMLLAELEKAYDSGLAVDALLERLSLLGSIASTNNGPAFDLPDFDEKTQSRCALYLLRILSFNRVDGFDTFLTHYLTSGDHAHTLLAISATTLNGQHSHQQALFSFLDTDNAALRIRACYSLCIRGSAEQHTRLLSWFEEHAFTIDYAQLIFNRLRLKSGDDYHVFAHQLSDLIRSRKGPFVDDDILAAALSLYDDIIASPSQNQDSEPSTQGLSAIHKNDLPSQHRQDISLSEEIAAYPQYSETIKIILRNAELTWQHSELFNHMVDKSTMLVQYSKSTDLLLQQRIGAPIFQKADDAFLSLLQTRVMELGLDTATFTQAKMIRHLKLEGFFTTREFPAHKLKTLTESIMSGKILADRFRAIDGLRAWSLILLLFARTFVINKTKFAPIIPMNKSAENTINGIVKLMNRFQDLRNSAAHHGVMVDLETLRDIRKDSFNLLNALEEVLP